MNKLLTIFLTLFCFNLFGASPSFQQVTATVALSTNCSVITNFNGTYYGNGGGLTNLNAANLVGTEPLSAVNPSVVTNQAWNNAGQNSVVISSNSTFIGFQAASNQVANGYGYYQNTAVGAYADWQDVAGAQNTAVGDGALFYNNENDEDTAIGYHALAGFGYSGVTFGTGNIGIGWYAGGLNTNGSWNIYIGNKGIDGVHAGQESSITRIGDVQTDAYIAGIIHGNGGGLTNYPEPKFTNWVATNVPVSSGQPANAILTNLSGLTSTNQIVFTNNTTWFDTNGAGIAAAKIATNNLAIPTTNGFVTATITNNLTNVFAPIEGVHYVSADYSILASDTFIMASNQIALTLPTAVGISGKNYTIKTIGTNVVSLVTTSGQTIDGQIYGGIAGWTLVSGGSGYTVGQITDVWGVNAPAMLRVDAVSGTQITAATLMSVGQGYSAASGVNVYLGGVNTPATINITSISAYIVSPQNNVVTVVSDGANWQTKVNRPAGLIPIGGVCYFFGGSFNISGTTDNAQLPLPSEFAEDNGQLITDRQSPMYNFTLPDVNGAGGQSRFLRGCTIASNQGMGPGGQDSVTNVWSHRSGMGIAGGTYWASGPYTNVISTVPSFVSATVVTRTK